MINLMNQSVMSQGRGMCILSNASDILSCRGCLIRLTFGRKKIRTGLQIAVTWSRRDKGNQGGSREPGRPEFLAEGKMNKDDN